MHLYATIRSLSIPAAKGGSNGFFEKLTAILSLKSSILFDQRKKWKLQNGTEITTGRKYVIVQSVVSNFTSY